MRLRFQLAKPRFLWSRALVPWCFSEGVVSSCGSHRRVGFNPTLNIAQNPTPQWSFLQGRTKRSLLLQRRTKSLFLQAQLMYIPGSGASCFASGVHTWSLLSSTEPDHHAPGGLLHLNPTASFSLEGRHPGRKDSPGAALSSGSVQVLPVPRAVFTPGLFYPKEPRLLAICTQANCT